MAQLDEANKQFKKTVTDVNEALGLSTHDPLIYDYQHDKCRQIVEFLKLGYQRKLADKEKAIRSSTDKW